LQRGRLPRCEPVDAGTRMNDEKLLNRIYGAIAEPARWSETLASVSDHIGSIAGMLIYNAPPGGKNLIVLARLDPDLVEIFHKHHVWNLWTLAMKDQPFNRAAILGSLVEHRAIRKTGFYADVLAPQRIEDTLNISHRGMARDGGIGGFGFSLSMEGRDRAEQSRRRLQRLTPHLCRALDATLQLGPLADGSRQLARVLQLMPNAALLLDNRQRIVHANPAAERLLREGDGLTSVSNGGLHLSAALPDENAALARSLAQALRVAGGGDDLLNEPLRVTRPSGAAPLLVVPVPLPPPAFSLWELSQTARLLVLVIDPAARNLSAATALQTVFGLTAAEARVATLIGSGLGGPQAAQALGVAPATVKTHLGRCFEKLGVRSQVELARLLSALPPDRANFDGMT
jgi:DNA-binding CsgD family transcriptional regulator/PAS domain-containing protein